MKILGISDEITTCDCCGKKGLKCTVAFETDGGDIVYYGRDCAGKAVHGRKSRANTEIVERIARGATIIAPVIAAVKAALSNGPIAAETEGRAAAKKAELSARVIETIDVVFYNWPSRKFIRVDGYGVTEEIPVAA